MQLMEQKPTKVWDTHVRKCESDGRKEKDTEWKEFRECMSKRYDCTDIVAQSRQKLDQVFQSMETVEKYIEKFMSLLSDVEVEYKIAQMGQLIN